MKKKTANSVPAVEKTATTKVYRYGLKTPPKFIQAQIDEQLRLAFTHRMNLWNCSMASRLLYRLRRRESFPEVEALELEIERVGKILMTMAEELKESKKEKTKSNKRVRELDDKRQPAKAASAKRKEEIDKQETLEWNVQDAFKAMKKENAENKAKLREINKRIKDDKKFQALIASDKERENVLRKALRALVSQQGLYCGTYLLVEEADLRSRLGKMDPARPRFNGTGSLGVQIQYGASPAELQEPNPALQIIRSTAQPWQRPSEADRAGKPVHLITPRGQGRQALSRTTFMYRVRSRDRKAVFVELRGPMQRQLPSDGKTKWVKLIVQKSGLRRMFSLHLTVESEQHPAVEPGAGTVVLCLNNDIVSYADSHALDDVQTFKFDPRLARVAQLQSTRDKERNEMVGRINYWCEDMDEVPEWLLEDLSHNTEKASCRKLVRLFYRWRDNRIAGDKQIFEKLKAWVYHENHLYQWQEDMRGSALRARKDAYRCFAKNLRRKYRHLILDNRTLETPSVKDAAANTAAFSELRLILKHQFGVDLKEASGNTPRQMFEYTPPTGGGNQEAAE